MEDSARLVDIVTAFDIEAESKSEAINQVVSKLFETGKLTNQEKFQQDVFDRESELSTYIGYGFGLPHAQSDVVQKATIGIGKLTKPVTWIDDKQVDFIFLIAVPTGGEEKLHLKILANLSRLLMHDDFRQKLRTLPEQKVYKLLIDNQKKL